MTIDLTPNNQQIKAENMVKYPDHKEWPYESLRTITEMISPSTTGNQYDAVYGDPIEHNIEIYKHDIAAGLAVDIEEDYFELFMPEFYINDYRGRESYYVMQIAAVMHSDKMNILVNALLRQNKIKHYPQYQYYIGDPSTNGLFWDKDKCFHFLLKFETKEDADAWNLAKMKESK
jgi:hypothetical protein